MNIRTIGFNPLVVLIDDIETPVTEISYLDEDGNNRKLSYVVFNGEKIPIEHRTDLVEKLLVNTLDETLVKVEEDRQKKIEDAKPK